MTEKLAFNTLQIAGYEPGKRGWIKTERDRSAVIITRDDETWTVCVYDQQVGQAEEALVSEITTVEEAISIAENMLYLEIED